MQAGLTQVFLVVEPMALVAEDLADLLREASPRAEVHICADARAAVPLLAGLTRLTAAFVNLAPTQAEQSGLIAGISALKGRCVSLWEPAEPRRDWLQMALPFSAGSVAQVIGLI